MRSIFNLVFVSAQRCVRLCLLHCSLCSAKALPMHDQWCKFSKMKEFIFIFLPTQTYHAIQERAFHNFKLGQKSTPATRS